MMRLLTLTLLCAFLASLAGCNTIQGAGRDIQKAGEAIERTAKGAKRG